MEPTRDHCEAEAGRTAPSPGEPGPRRHARHGLIGLACLAVCGFLGYEARALWVEWSSLEKERAGDLRSRVVGYTAVSPTISYAKPPQDWFHDEGDHSVLWAGWDRQARTHQWFRLERGEIDPGRLTHPMGRDSVRAIDYPRIEVGGGEVWDSIRATDLVATFELQGQSFAYPFDVLDKVLIVNDEIPDTPLLVVFAPFEEGESAVSIFSPVVGPERLRMGHSGYLCDGHPLLFDRKTESLWIADGRGLTAVSGRFRGAKLKRIARASAVAWGPWHAGHPETRLVVGATRPGMNPAR